MKTYVVANQKGGVGKTTTALAIASVLIREGYKVLFIDADRQCNSTDTYFAKFEGIQTLYDVILADEGDRIPLSEAIQHTESGDIVPSDPLLRKADKILYDEIDGIYRLRDALSDLKGYDYVIIDTPPANNSILQSCLTAADEVIIPTTADRYSIQGLSEINSTINAVRKRPNPDLKIAGILITKFAKRTNLDNETKESLNKISEMMDTKVFNSCIRTCIKVREAQAVRRLLFDYDAKCNASLDYIDMVKELIGEKYD